VQANFPFKHNPKAAASMVYVVEICARFGVNQFDGAQMAKIFDRYTGKYRHLV
jgi:hypothetical protein